MRMDRENKLTALLWLKEANVDEISDVLKDMEKKSTLTGLPC